MPGEIGGGLNNGEAGGNAGEQGVKLRFTVFEGTEDRALPGDA